MSASTKLILITPDEDLIRRFSLNKVKNIHIINFDNDEQVASTVQIRDSILLSEVVRS